MAGEHLRSDLAFAVDAFGGLDRLVAIGRFDELNTETVGAILDEAERFAEAELQPLYRVGDRSGATISDGAVTTPPGWREAYRRWVAAGWNGIGCPPEWGGQGLPIVVQMAVQEIWNAANPAFAVGPMLTNGAVHALMAHASGELQQRFLPHLVSGEWMATMNLTEPQAGSDLGAIRTKAIRAADGSYRISGQKIFITYGEHDLTANIVHLVLARLEGAPAGTAGISMFVVPKTLDDGSRNDVFAAGLEHKLGLHGSPTCTMVYGGRGEGAAGWIVGEENRGLAAMFTMMNLARLNVGVQGVGVAERACRQAFAYAKARQQGRAPGAKQAGAIGAHPDVQRMLARMAALTTASRALCLACAEAMDMSVAAADAGERQLWADRASLLTPVAKAFATDAANEVTSLNIQVHGGAGYIEETGAAQLARDARIFAIYEGTNGIQAIDLVTRKLKLGDGAAIAAVIAEIEATAESIGRINAREFGATAGALRSSSAGLRNATEFLGKALAEHREADALAGATPYFRLLGLAFGGALLAKGALSAVEGERDRAVALARFHAEAMLGEAPALAAAVMEGPEGLRQAARYLGLLQE
jgi:alkylation response protein AidB-like acyl-CoA dehydrogenase